jgi:TrpR-related protein YerC/YecD
MSKFRNKNVDFLFESVLTLKNLDECYDFFEDICTIKELQSIAQRVVVAKMLIDGRVYSEIVKETGASTATISRVNRSLTYGNDGYSIAFGRLEDNK